ncbi:GNAT family N-acetyltransferase [Streptomyces sp. DSM 40750]|uniref:GNAT family N-acetyltransferase n=1 Tax=Streptomyces sp. DSM 40750 TaxID=2801030 RepID=UPI00214AB148|nr:GNAT family N-acetyltransferase [Streptomyces sp. DSM 40750]UUU25992.1 GNAT family N-acetyltransferase [Streptomyces sp. DSM 40750]
MRFRNGTPEDAERVAALHTASWQTAYAELMPSTYLNGPLREDHLAKWRARTADPHGRWLLLAEDGDELRGFIHLVTAPDGRIHVDNLHARPGRLGTGIGHRLLRRGFAWAAAEHPGQDVYLEVLRGNDRAIAFYERQGGIRTAEGPVRLSPDLVLNEIEYTWPAAKVQTLAKAPAP